MGRGPLELLLLPWNLTMHSHRFFDNPAQPVLFSAIGPLFLMLLPLLLLLGRLSRESKFPALYAMGF